VAGLGIRRGPGSARRVVVRHAYLLAVSGPAAVRIREPRSHLYHRWVSAGSRLLRGFWRGGLRAATFVLALGMADDVLAQAEPENLPPARVAAPVGKDMLDKRLKVTGRWVGGRLVATRVEQRDPRKEPTTGRVTGPLDQVGPEPRTLHFGPVVVVWADGT